MGRREPIPEQKAKAAERREKFNQIAKQIAAMTDEQRATLAARMVGVMTCEGKTVSHKNLCLLAHQRESVTMVGGFRQWLKQGRVVRKGEHGLTIWVPHIKGNAEQGEAEEVRFGLGTVFDVSQTDALPPRDAPPQAEVAELAWQTV